MTSAGTANQMAEAQITVKLNGGTYLTFTMGDPIRPMVSDVRYIFAKLYRSTYVEKVVPMWATSDQLLHPDTGILYELVPSVLVQINELIASGDYAPEHEYFITVSAYVLAWWYHLNAGGPRPIYETARERQLKRAHRIKLTEPILRCEFCNKIYKPPVRLITYSAMAAAYYRWLPRHYWEYHKWTGFKPIKKSRTKVEVDNEPES